MEVANFSMESRTSRIKTMNRFYVYLDILSVEKNLRGLEIHGPDSTEIMDGLALVRGYLIQRQEGFCCRSATLKSGGRHLKKSLDCHPITVTIL